MDISATTSKHLDVHTSTRRVESIDLLRGLVMIIMAIDHIRDYFHYSAFHFDPTNLSKTHALFFFTRWITHFCAPTFMFLSGTSAYLVGIRKGKKALSKFLLTRGLWLIFLEFTVVSVGWYFNFPFTSIDFIVIWALGACMVILAALIWLPFPAVLVIGLLMVFGHNLLDNVHVPGQGLDAFGWSILHQPGFFSFEGKPVLVLYPLIPWIGVMALGYCMGKWYDNTFTPAQRKKRLLWLGCAMILLFIILRAINIYGDASHWTQQPTPLFTFLSFLNVSKYPPSLLYLLMTLGPGLVFLALTENSFSWLAERIKVIGRVPMFYYILHIYLVHLAAMIATYFCGFEPGDMILNIFPTEDPKLQSGFGFPLIVVYAVWIVLVIILYFLCNWYDRYKRTHRYWWLSYL